MDPHGSARLRAGRLELQLGESRQEVSPSLFVALSDLLLGVRLAVGVVFQEDAGPRTKGIDPQRHVTRGRLRLMVSTPRKGETAPAASRHGVGGPVRGHRDDSRGAVLRARRFLDLPVGASQAPLHLRPRQVVLPADSQVDFNGLRPPPNKQLGHRERIKHLVGAKRLQIRLKQ